MKTIYLLTITVLARISSSTLTTAEINVAIPSAFKLVDYDPDNTAKSSEKIGIKNLYRNAYFNDENIYDYSNGEVIEKIKVTDSQDFLKIKNLLKIMCREDDNHYIRRANSNSCVYVVSKNTSTNVYYAAFYFVFKVSKITLIEMFLKKKGFINEVQWQLDMMIKITKAVKALHRLGFVHRDITPDSIMFFNDIKEPIQSPVLINFQNAMPLNHPKSYPFEPNFFTPPFTKVTDLTNPKFDVYSLGRLFYVIMNHKFAIKNSRYRFYHCQNGENELISKYYCKFFEPLFSLMMSDDISNTPSIDNVLEGLRAIRKRLNKWIRTNYLTFKNMLDTGKRINSKNQEVELTAEWRQAVEDAKRNNSYFYDHYVLDVYKRIEAVYPDNSDQRKADFYKEHEEMINSLKQRGYIQRILV